MNEERKYDDYWWKINKAVVSIQEEFGLGHIDSETVLHQCISDETDILNDCEAFDFFTMKSPYDWEDYVNAELMEKYDYNLGEVARHVCNGVLFNDVLAKVEDTRAYDFLMGDRGNDFWTPPLFYKNFIMTFKEHWSSEAGALDYLPPIEIFNLGGKEITQYQEGGQFIYTAKHEDPALVWISTNVYPDQPLEEGHFRQLSLGMLRHFGFPSENLWLAECQTTKDFAEYYGNDYGLESFDFIVYWHESGSVIQHKCFNNFSEFITACQFVAEH